MGQDEDDRTACGIDTADQQGARAEPASTTRTSRDILTEPFSRDAAVAAQDRGDPAARTTKDSDRLRPSPPASAGPPSGSAVSSSRPVRGGVGQDGRVPTLRIAQDDAADELLGRDPLGLLIGTLLDQHTRRRSS